MFYKSLCTSPVTCMDNKSMYYNSVSDFCFVIHDAKPDMQSATVHIFCLYFKRDMLYAASECESGMFTWISRSLFLTNISIIYGYSDLNHLFCYFFTVHVWQVYVQPRSQGLRGETVTRTLVKFVLSFQNFGGKIACAVRHNRIQLYCNTVVSHCAYDFFPKILER